MSHSRDLIDDLAVHALGANDGPDRAALEVAVRTDPSLRDSIAGFDRVVDVMLDSFEDSTPSPSVWEAIEQKIAEPAPARNVPWAWLTTIAAAVAIVATFALVVTSQSSDPSVSELAADLQADPTAIVWELVDPATGAELMSVVADGEGIAYAVVAGLPTLSNDQTYQLWSVVGDEIVSVGLLGPDPTAVPLRLESEPAALALTVEVAGGVAVSEATPVAVWTRETTS